MFAQAQGAPTQLDMHYGNMDNGIVKANPFVSPFSPIKAADAAPSRQALGNVGNQGTLRHRTAGMGKGVKTFLPAGPQFQNYEDGFDAPAKGDESLISLGDVCDDLNILSPRKSALNMSSTVYGFGRMTPVQEDTSLVDFGFGKDAFGDANLSIGYELAAIPASGVEQVRAARGSVLTADVRIINEQIRSTDAGTLPADSIEFARTKTNQENTANVRMVNEQFRGANVGEQHHFDLSSMQLSKERASQANVDSVRRVNEQARGSNPGERHYFSTDSKQLSAEVKAQNVVADYARVNEQVNVNVVPGNLPADCIENVRTKFNQQTTANVRMVNEQFRGANVGEKHLFDLDSKQLKQEASAQNTLANIVRVSEQARGELAGMQTAYDINAREMIRHQTQQSGVAVYSRVNEQNFGVEAGNIPSDSVENVRAKSNQKNTADVRMVNEQFRSEAVGMPTMYSTDAKQMSTEVFAQKRYNNSVRVNEQARGEFAGVKTLVDSTAEQFVRAAAVPKVNLVNQQVKHVGRGAIPHDSAYSRHVTNFNQQRADQNIRAKSLHGVSSFGAGSVEAARLSAAPKPAAQLTTARGEFAGAKTSFGMDSKSMSTAANAPKTALYNNQMRYGAVKFEQAPDASSFNKASEWKPASEMIITHQEDDVGAAPPVQETQAPSPIKDIAADASTANFFGLKKSTRRTKPVTKPAWEPNYSAFTGAVKSFR